jgi:hypothetical protein
MYALIVSLIGIVILLGFLVIAIYVAMHRERSTAAALSDPILHKSGIYSIVRKSPSANMAQYKPSESEIISYLASQAQLSETARLELATRFRENLASCIAEVETGDREGAEFYYYTFRDDDPVCARYIKKGRFVTREEIFQHPQILPPFHLGCSCQIKAYKGSENLQRTTELNMFPFFKDATVPELPDWKTIG